MRTACPLTASRPALWLAVLAVVLVVACGKVPVGTLWKLRKLDWATLDAKQVAAAVHLPPGVEFAPRAVAIDVVATRGATGEQHKARLWMRPSAQGAAPAPAPRPGHWVHLRLGEDDLVRLQSLREQTQVWKADAATSASGAKNQLAVSIEPRLCERGAASTPTTRSQWFVSAWLRWAPDPGYVPVLDDLRMADAWNDLPQPLERCE